MNTLATPSNGGSGASNSVLQAQRFSISGGPWNIDSIVVKLTALPTPTLPAPTVSIYSNNAAATTPGGSLLTFSTFTPTLNPDATYRDYTFTGTGDPNLGAGTYWIVFGGNNAGSTTIAANDLNITNTGTNGVGDFVRRTSSSGGTWIGTDRTFLWAINATAVPEPTVSTLALAGLCLLRRRREST